MPEQPEQPQDSQDRTADSKLEESDPRRVPFTPEVLDRTVIAIPLLRQLEAQGDSPGRPFAIIIDLNLEYRDGRKAARERALAAIDRAIAEVGNTSIVQGINRAKSDLSEQYLFGELEGPVIRRLVQIDNEEQKQSDTPDARRAQRAIHHIWPDFPIEARISRTIATVKADAARTAFGALGSDIVWAVMDSGIDGSHPHFQRHKNMDLDPSLAHRDFTALQGPGEPLRDACGHGTHVAGIIAGEVEDAASGEHAAGRRLRIVALARQRDEQGRVGFDRIEMNAIAGMAPRCKLLSLKVLDNFGRGLASNLIAAIGAIQDINGHGRRLRVHGVNISIGYDFEPEWFACGQSPLCVEVDRLVRSGVVVVVAAGNTGYGSISPTFKGPAAAGVALTINDPGNAALAITVGSTHRDMPHVYGVSYFSSKGPTGDGRNKPDLVAPGEKILSCAAGQLRSQAVAHAAAGRVDSASESPPTDCLYVEQSGTSMAAPHVSGVIAAFLSIRREFIGRPEDVKRIFTTTATDLDRDRYFQGSGLIDLMRAIQSV